MYSNEIIHNIWRLPVPARHVYQNSDVKDTYTQRRLWCQPAMFLKIGTFLETLGIDHLSACTAQAGLYSRDGIFFKSRLPSLPSATPRQVERIFRIFHVVIDAGHRWFVISWKAINGRCMGTYQRFSFDIPKIQVL